MLGNSPRLSLLLERLLPVLMLGFLLLYTYALFSAMPYAGFRYNSEGQVVELYVQPGIQTDLHLDDRLIQVGPTLWSDFRQNFRLPLFEGAKPGDVIPLVIERDGQTLTIPWLFPGFNTTEMLQRLNSQWLLPYFFWLAGTVVMLTIRPKDKRWRLLIIFYYLTALWLMTGNGVAQAHVWEAGMVLISAVWLSLPVYWHLHWNFPQPFRRVPRVFWWFLYGIAAVLALAPWFGLLPHRLYVYGLLLAIGGAIILLLLHYRLQPSQRRGIRLLVTLAVLAVAPLVAIGMARAAGLSLPYYVEGGSLLALALLPIGYFYAAYRRQLGGMELRRNRLLSLYLFVVILDTALIILLAVADIWLDLSPDAVFISITFSLLAALIAIFGYGPFQRLVERRLLRIPPAPTHLLEMYAASIATRLDIPGLISLLKDDVLPGLLVRQSALLRFDELNRMQVLYQVGIDADGLPIDRDIPILLANARQYRPLPQAQDAQQLSSSWVRLALPILLGDQIIGVWLLGHRDPDDEYAPSEITVLRGLADQTAIALAHIVQSELLRGAYKADIDRMETERANLARELHDHVLGDLAELKERAEMQAPSPDFLETYHRVTTGLRQTITGLRPAMLNYGLWAALSSLADLLIDRAQNHPIVELNVPETNVRYDANLEQHLYRIVQQSCENALRHAQPERLTIYGHLEQGHIDLTVEDDGVGFEAGEHLDLAGLIAHKHFGLAGMHERAALIHAQLLIDSAPRRGTRIQIICSSPDH